jgi:hypothetical protein
MSHKIKIIPRIRNRVLLVNIHERMLVKDTLSKKTNHEVE